MVEFVNEAAIFANDGTSLTAIPSSSPTVFSTITTTISAVVAASSNTSFNGVHLSPMDEFITKSLLLIDFSVALVAILFNIFVLFAVKKANHQSMLEGYRGFLLSLAFSDLLIATTTLFTPIAEFLPNTRVSSFVDRCGRTIVRSFTIAAYMSALLNLAGMSVDHYIGVFYSLRYHQFMTTRVVCVTVALSWLLSIVFGFFDLFGTVAHFSVQSNDNGNPPLPFGSRFVEVITEGADVMGDSGASITSNPKNSSGLSGVRIDKHFNKLLIDILFGPAGASNNSNSAINWEDLNTLDDSLFMQTATSSSTTSSTPAPSLASLLQLPKKTRTMYKPTASTNPAKDGVLDFDEMEKLLNAYGTGDINSTDFSNKLEIGPSENFPETFSSDFDNRFMDWCSYYTLNKQLMEFAVVFLTLVVFVGLLLIYGRIFREVSSKRDEKGMSHKTGKLVVTTVILLGAFFFCWIPFITFEAVMVLLIRTDTIRLLKAETHQQLMIVNKILNTTLILHPLLDPLIYAIRVRVVRNRLRKVYLSIVGCRELNSSSLTFRSSTAMYSGSTYRKESEYRGVANNRLSVSPCVVARRNTNRDAFRDSKPLLNRFEVQNHSAIVFNNDLSLKGCHLVVNDRTHVVVLPGASSSSSPSPKPEDLRLISPAMELLKERIRHASIHSNSSHATTGAKRISLQLDQKAAADIINLTRQASADDQQRLSTTIDVNLRRVSSAKKPDRLVLANSNDDDHCPILRKPSFSWSSFDELEAYNLYEGGINTSYIKGGDDEASSISICSSDYNQDLMNPNYVTAIKMFKRPAISANFIMDKVERHTRMLFAVNGCDLPLTKRPEEPLDRDSLQESAL